MKIFTKIAETQLYLQQLKPSRSIGFVPTMGALHEGHLQLLRRSKKENEICVCSIFVNPIQFNNPVDLKKYPRTLETDIEKLKSIDCDVLFAPEVKEMYPEKNTRIYEFGMLDKVMEGKFRPGHFNGVAVVVKRLFDIIDPHKAYFGEKDFQQLAIINAMVKQEKINIEIVPCSIVREKDGLAMSSRNVRLNHEERKVAPVIHQTLKDVKEKIYTQDINELCKWAVSTLNQAPGMEVEYFEIVDTESLQTVADIKETAHTIACVAAYLGKVRLIDNMRLT